MSAAVALRQHHVVLRPESILLRPMTEGDWAPLFRWNNDPEVLWFSEGDHITSRTLDEVQAIYRSVSQTAHCFIIEHRGEPVGECWLQQMNLPRVLEREQGRDCRRIDITIGERRFWGRGIGTVAVRLLVRFAFDVEHADAVFAVDVADYNERSRRLWLALGFEPYLETRQPRGAKAAVVYDYILRRQRDARPASA